MIILYKPRGVTPYQAIMLLKEKEPGLLRETVSYAGRLDPMAEGLLLLLVGDENKERRQYEKLEKVYEFEAVLGVSSDSYDLLGVAKLHEAASYSARQVQSFIESRKGKIVQTYPPYSSVKIQGRPLYWWTRNKKRVTLPKKEVEILEFEFLKEQEISKGQLGKLVSDTIPNIVGDFRQKEIIDTWESLLHKLPEKKSFSVLSFRMKCSAGAYVRSMVQEFGEYLGCGAITLSIKRTQIGEYALIDAVRI